MADGRRGNEGPFDMRDPAAAWDAGAAPWDHFVRSGADYYRTEVHGPALLRACGGVCDVRALDLGCGQGWFSRELARRGARVTGVDISGAMLERAIRYEAEQPLGIRYHLADAAAVREVVEGRFGLATACMSLQDMTDPDRVLTGVTELLEPGGRLACSVPHPLSDQRFREWERDSEGRKLYLKVDGYFESGAAECHWNMERLTGQWTTPYWRRTLEEWSDLFHSAGLSIRRLYEPRPTTAQVRAMPELEDCSRMPYFVVFDLRGPE